MHLLKFDYILIAALFFSVPMAFGIDLPAPYFLPAVPHPGDPDICLTCSGKSPKKEPGILRTSGNMVMEIRLGECPFIDTGGLLTVNLGYTMPYRPGEYFTIIPPGDSRGDKSYLLVLEGENKFVFKTSSGDMSGLSMTSPDSPGVLLKRDGENILVINLKRKQVYTYETKDYGVTWRLNSIRRLDAPELTVKCLYSKKEGKLEKIILPGDVSYELAYNKDNAISTVNGPDGTYTKFEYDSLGGIKSVSSYIPPLHPYASSGENLQKSKLLGKKDILVNQILTESDTSGRVASITLANGKRYLAEYRLDVDKKSGTTVKETVLTEPDGQKRFFERIHDKKANTITTRMGRYTQKDSKSAPKKLVKEERVLKRVGNTFVVVSQSKNGKETKFDYGKEDKNVKNITDSSGNNIDREYNEFGLLTKMEKSGETEKELVYDENGMVVSETKNEGRSQKFEYNEQGKIISHTDFYGLSYKVEYNNSGTPAKIMYGNGDIYELEWDSQLRLTKLKRNDGTSCEWTYKGSLRVPFEYTDHPDGKHPEIAFNFKYAYDQQGRLVRTDYYDGTYETWKYNCCNIVEYRNRIGKITKMAYDSNDNLVQLTKTDIGKTQIFYDVNGRRTKVIYPDYKFDTWEYDEAGRVIAETKKDGTKIKRQFTDDGKLKREDFSDGKFKELEYDNKGRIISSRGINNYKVTYAQGETQGHTEYYKDASFSGIPCYISKHPINNRSSGENQAESNKDSLAIPPLAFVSGISQRHDGIFEHKSKTQAMVMIYLFKKYQGTSFSFSSIPGGEYLAAENDSERDALIAKYRKESGILTVFDNEFEKYRDGKLAYRSIYGPDSQLCEQIKSYSGKTERMIYGYDYHYDGFPRRITVKKESVRINDDKNGLK